MSNKESEICEFEMDFKKSIACVASVSLPLPRHSFFFCSCPSFLDEPREETLATQAKKSILFAFQSKKWWNNFLDARSENGCEKSHFLVWNGVRIWRTRRHTPTKNFQEYPRRDSMVLNKETRRASFSYSSRLSRNQDKVNDETETTRKGSKTLLFR